VDEAIGLTMVLLDLYFISILTFFHTCMSIEQHDDLDSRVG